MKTILTVLGARPQFIKASVVSHAMERSGRLREVVVHTGQHFDANMSDVFFSELGMRKPDHFLDIHGGAHGEMTGRMLIEVERVLLAEQPDAVLVYGDTNSTLAGALAAVKLHVPVAHVEAGLRSFNMRMPEEVNRILTDRVSHWLFTPTDAAAAHLRQEGVPPERIIPVGDVMLDVALHQGARVHAQGGVMAREKLNAGRFILATIHRAENTDHPHRLAAIVEAFTRVAEQMPVVWPLHPRTRAVLQLMPQWALVSERVRLVEPLGYLDMVQLEKHAALIVTDSGGVQKEAFFHGVPCVTLRDETEWVELVEAGWNLLLPPGIGGEMAEIIMSRLGTVGRPVAPYGRGDASARIVEVLCQD